MRPQLIVMRGISGSGKSTIAKQMLHEYSNTIIVSRDDLRIAFYDTEFGPPIDEDFITDIEESVINNALGRGVSVISDNTNLQPFHVTPKFRLAEIHGAKIHLREVDVSLDVAKHRNRIRSNLGGRFVPEHVIDAQFAAFNENRDEVLRIYRECFSET